MQEFVKKIVRIQSILNAPKTQYNTFGKYYYRNCEDILEALKPLLRDEGLYQIITDTIEQVGERYYIRATVTVSDGAHSIENTACAREEEMKKGMDASQITGTASSYARKYALNGMWCIDDNKDADTNEQRQQIEQTPVTNQATGPKRGTATSHWITPDQIAILSEAIVAKGYTVPDACGSFGVSALADISPSIYNTLLDTVNNDWPVAGS